MENNSSIRDGSDICEVGSVTAGVKTLTKEISADERNNKVANIPSKDSSPVTTTIPSIDDVSQISTASDVTTLSRMSVSSESLSKIPEITITTTTVNVCKNCGKFCPDSETNTDQSTCDSESIDKCERWLKEKCSLSDCESIYSLDSSEVSSVSQALSETTEDSESITDSLAENPIANLCHKVITPHENVYGKVKIVESKHVLIGNKTIIKGPVYIQNSSSVYNQQNINNHLFLNATDNLKPARRPLRIIPRRDWLAQPPLQYNPLPEPVKYVVICHTATEEGFTNADNIHLVRVIQTYHIESRKWDDIGYNFLVGSDGLIYEGRGWGFQGAFAYGYNRRGFGIAFVGCFMDHLPPTASLNAAQDLIKKGVELGYIPSDYVLVGHCQCSAVESPGKKLYEVIKTWSNWRELTEEDV